MYSRSETRRKTAKSSPSSTWKFREINNFSLESVYFVSLSFITFSFGLVFLEHSRMKPGWSNDTPQYYLDKGYTYEYLSNGYFLVEIGKFEIFISK